MTAVKFGKKEALNRLQANIMLDTGIKLSKKEIMEILFEFGSEDYDRLLSFIRRVKSPKPDTKELRQQFIDQFSGCIELDEEEEIDPKQLWERKPED